MAVAPETTIQFIPRGGTSSRTLRVASGASDLTLSGTYTLRNPAGTAVVDGAAFASNAYTLTLADDVTLGAGWRESWTFTTGSQSYTVHRRVIVTETLDSRMLLVDHATLLVLYPILSYMPTGYSSWELQCVAATREILQILADRTQQAVQGDLLNADALFMPTVHAALRNIGRAAALFGAEVYQTMADTHEAELRDWLRRMRLDFDTDGDGDADRTDRLAPDATGPLAPAPLGV